MKKVFEIFKKYLVISFIFSSAIIVPGVVSIIKSNAIPIIDFVYIAKVIFCILVLTVIFVPVIAFIVWPLKDLLKDYKESDRKGRIILIVICISMLLRKILIWIN